MDASAFSSLSAVARSCLAMWGAQFFAHPLFRGNPKITLRIATAVIANAIVAVTRTRYFRFSPKIPLPTRYARSPLTTAQGAAVKERGHLTAALPYLAQARLGEIFSVPRSLCGAVQFTALSGSFGHLCTSRNARVPLRYASQPFRRKPAPSRSLIGSVYLMSSMPSFDVVVFVMISSRATRS